MSSGKYKLGDILRIQISEELSPFSIEDEDALRKVLAGDSPYVPYRDIILDTQELVDKANVGGFDE